MPRRLRGLLAILALTGILAGLPLALTVAGTLPTHWPGWHAITDALRAPDDGTIALGAITLIGWGAWLILAAAILAELIARARGVTAPQLPHGMRWAQGVARALVAAAAITLAAGAPTATAHAAPTTTTIIVTHTPATTRPPTEAQLQAPAAVTAEPAAQVRDGWEAYTVRYGDTLWAIAADRLGDGTQYRQIADANRGVLGDTPGFLQPGWILQIPAPALTSSHVRSVVVEPGDTLSAIAATELGDLDRYPELAAATAPVTQPDGHHLTNPDQIRPGWHIVIPTTDTHAETPNTAAKPAETPPAVTDTDPASTPTIPEPTPVPAPEHSHARPAPAATQPPAASTTVESSPATPAEKATTTAGDAWSETAAPGWMIAGLAGPGTILAGTLLLLLRRRRQAAFRARRPGRAAAPVPAHLARVERAIAAHGAPTVDVIETVDAALRALAIHARTTGQPLPDLAAVQVSADTITAHLAGAADLPTPWTCLDDTRRRWVHPIDAALEQDGDELADQPAPWPLLATIGADPHGHIWLLNAEAYPLLHVHGDPDTAGTFTRHVIAELATSPWARDLTIDCPGFPELGPLNPYRLRTRHLGQGGYAAAAAEATDLADRAADAHTTGLATARAHQAGDELWPARMLVTHPDPDTTDEEALAGLVHVLQAGRPTGTTLLLLGETDTLAVQATSIVLAPGSLTLPDFGLTLTPVHLTKAEGTGCAALIAGRSHLDDVPMPTPTDPAAAWQRLTAVDGSIRDDLTLARDTPHEAGDAPSLLPLPDTDYLTVAATTADDLAHLAPRIPESVAADVHDADPDLDADLAAWTSPDCALPRLILLGPVHARTHGDPYAVTERKAYYTEVLAWLALHPGGGTTDQVADALNITANRVRVDIKAVRDWLGTNPLTGARHLPDARQSRAGKAQGRGIYQIDGLLTDLDLFRRLRARGQARGGEDGMRDLATALTLVTGRPFTGCRDGGWSWLYDGDRVDEHMVCAIVDVAHLVVIDALQKGDTALARAAADVAAQAAPYEDTPRLDLAAIARAEGRLSVADDIITEQICNRSDDPGLPPTELPERTRRILAAHPTAKAS